MLPSRLPRAQRRLVVSLILLAGAGCSLLLWRYAEHQQSDRIQAEFQRRAQLHAALVRESLGAYEDTLLGLRTLFTGSREVTRDEFTRASRDLLQRRAGVKALQWVQIVPAKERAGVERTASAELNRPFVIRRRQADGTLHPAEPRDEYLAILYIEPLAGNEPALGYDVSSAPSAASLAAARRDGRLKVSRAFHLAQSTSPDDEPGVVFILPVSQGPAQQVTGFIQAVFGVRTMLAQVHRYGKYSALDSYYADLDADPAHPELLYVNLGGREPQATPGYVPVLPATADFDDLIVVGDRHWRLRIGMNPVWARQQQNLEPAVILGSGLIITCLLALLLRNLLKRTAQVEEEVGLRTAELVENRRELDSILRALPGTAFRCGFDDKLTALFVSEGMLALSGYAAEDFTSGRRHIPDLTVPADRPAVRAAVSRAAQERRPFEIEYRFTHRDGQEKWVLVRGRPIYDATDRLRFLEGLAIDITVLKRAEQERMNIERRLLEGQKLESLGVMAGGVAHDFNNILTSVLASASLARHLVAGEAVGHLEQVENAARRAADLCQHLLAYAGKGQLVTGPIDLSELVRGTVSLFTVTISKNIRLELQLADGLPPVLADVTQLRQIVMNLVINAADAIGESPGQIIIRTYVHEAAAELFQQAQDQPDLPGGTYVGMEVMDNGYGMSPETIRRIFEPFFSTKFSGRGLGLAAVRGIVRSHRGALFVESQPGAGATFRLLLPETQGPAVPSAPPMVAAAGPVRLNGLVVVVDDEETVRGIVSDVLETFGATVLPAAGGEEALALLRTHGDRVALVLLDLTMPGLSGEETLRRLRLMDARPPVVIMSGYSETETVKLGPDLGVASFIRKPFEIATLLERVKPHLR
jgi:two-component system cell cycle sensor histidine kinase/response regulator CckA